MKAKKRKDYLNPNVYYRRTTRGIVEPVLTAKKAVLEAHPEGDYFSYKDENGLWFVVNAETGRSFREGGTRKDAIHYANIIIQNIFFSSVVGHGYNNTTIQEKIDRQIALTGRTPWRKQHES